MFFLGGDIVRVFRARLHVYVSMLHGEEKVPMRLFPQISEVRNMYYMCVYIYAY